ncbi:MAG: NADH-quinone oxidoreductase subunit M [Phycisphaerales bacterium]|nr:NADH-quinone oxidoreductase subunit M [Phycisphaerales bacterium]
MAILTLPQAQAKKARTVALFVCFLTLALAILAATRFNWASGAGGVGRAQLTFSCEWIRALGARYSVGVDCLSLPLVMLTAAIALLACWASYGITKFTRGYYALLLFLVSGTIGVFVSLDLLLFLVFFELAAVPLYFLIGIWGGGERRDVAATRMILFSVIGALAILCAVLGICYHTRGLGGEKGGVLDLLELAGDRAVGAQFCYGGGAYWFGMVAFGLCFFGFAVRMAAVPVHSWLAGAHAEAPTPISMLIAGTLQTTGAYGLLRVCYSIFPEQAAHAWFYVSLLGILTILYGIFVAMAQRDLKRLAAFWSMAAMGWIILGVGVMSAMAFTGVVFQLIAQGLVASLFFFTLGILVDRAHHAEISRFGGLWSHMPAYSGWAVLAFLAAMGLPGLCGFVGQLLILLGIFTAGDANGLLITHTNGEVYMPLLWFGGLAILGMLLTVACLLWTFQRLFMGASRPEHQNFAGLSTAEKWIMASLGLAVVVLGVAPMLILDRIRPVIEVLMKG